jgi:hypothetical protein
MRSSFTAAPALKHFAQFISIEAKAVVKLRPAKHNGDKHHASVFQMRAQAVSIADS